MTIVYILAILWPFVFVAAGLCNVDWGKRGGL